MITLQTQEDGVEKGSKLCEKCQRKASFGLLANEGRHDTMCVLFGVFLEFENGEYVRCDACIKAEV